MNHVISTITPFLAPNSLYYVKYQIGSEARRIVINAVLIGFLYPPLSNVHHTSMADSLPVAAIIRNMVLL